jgi:hypothetical protein
MKTFREWLVAREDSAADRTRTQAALGLGPDIPDAEINSRNTAPAWQSDLLTGKKSLEDTFGKKHKRHKTHKKGSKKAHKHEDDGLPPA